MVRKKIEDFLDVILMEKPTKNKLNKLGISEEELKHFMDSILQGKEIKAYNRILSEDEKRVLSPEAFGYLVNLLCLKSIDRDMFERIITLSMQLNIFVRKKIDKQMMDDIVNLIIFSGKSEISIKDLLDIFFIHESEFDFDDEIQ